MAKVYACPDVEAIRALYAPVLGPWRAGMTIAQQLAAEADILFAAHQQGNEIATVQLSNWHPDWVGKPADDILAAVLTLADARLCLAREYGFADWGNMITRGEARTDETYEAAVDAMLAGELDSLSGLLDASPQLATARSAYGHQAGLVHYIAANGVETWRQVVPMNADALLETLLHHGADVNASVPIYGGSRPLGLLETSAHPKAAGLDQKLATLMRAAGAT